ncbi:glycyl radical protein, partial [Thermodesulfobacteriota bacterium]
LYVSAEEKQEILKMVDFWEGKTVESWVRARLPKTSAAYMEGMVYASVSGLYYDIGHMLPAYDRVLETGLAETLAGLKKQLMRVDLTAVDAIAKKHFYESAIITCEAAIGFAHRYADKAEELAISEKDPTRKHELDKIAEICRRVPEYPARNFHEALQSFWFIHLLVLLESKGMGVSPGRFDQYMYPFYQKGLEEGMLSEDEAENLLKQLWLKFNEVNYVLDSPTGRLIGGYPSRANLVLGGQTTTGKDAVNQLSFLCLKVTEAIGLHQPSLSVRYHTGISEKFLRECCRLIRTGLGFPAIYNDEIDIPALLSRGVRYEDAQNFALVGCVELAVPGKSWTNPAGSKFNLVRCLELAMNGGRLPDTNRQLGPVNDDVDAFKNFDEFFIVYREQVEKAVENLVTYENLVDSAQAELVPCPFLSCLIEDCIGRGIDVKRGGAIYNFSGPQGVGLANAADSLAAIKKLVFEEKRISLPELKQVLDSNFENRPEIRRMLLDDAPKYGNDDDAVDLIARDVMDIFARKVASYQTPRGGQFQAGMFPATANVAYGQRTGATPDGRIEGEPFADSVSPAPGRDKESVVAVLKSASKLNHMETSNGTLINQKLHPLTLKTERGIQNLAALLRAFGDLKCMEVQFNVVDADTLRAAQQDPEMYKSLVVRVAGWSALFTGLSREVQEDIISRTEKTELM